MASLLAALLAPSVAFSDAAPVASGGTTEPSTLAGSPTAFAERLATSHRPTAGARSGDSLQDALELIVLAAVCALAVALYSSASAERDRTPSARWRRRR